MAIIDRLRGWMGGGAPAGGSQRSGPVQAYTIMDLDDPALLEFLSGGRMSAAGLAVNERVALRNSTLFRAVSLISGSIGMLPLHLMRRKADGTIEKARDHPLFNVLHRRPNDFQTAAEFKSFMQLAALFDGNAYALIVRSRGAIRQLIPLPRRSVTPKLSDDFTLTFDYRRPSGGTVTLTQDEVFHFRSPISIDGLRGVSLLDVCTDTLGLALTAQRAAGKMFSKGVMAGGALETDQRLGDEAIKNLRESLKERHSGSENAGEWLVLEQGLKAKPFSGSAKDAQLAEVRKHEAEELARITGVPRPLLMFDETSWGSGIEQLGLFFVTYCLMTWFVIWEEAVWRMLQPAEQDSLYAKFNAGALLRGSLKDQAEFFNKALAGAPWMVQNETRESFDLNPLEGGDDLGKAQGAALAAAAPDPEPTDPAPPSKKRAPSDA